MFLLVPAYPGSPGQQAVKQLCVCVRAGRTETRIMLKMKLKKPLLISVVAVSKF